jgi:hypothetical protein
MNNDGKLGGLDSNSLSFLEFQMTHALFLKFLFLINLEKMDQNPNLSDNLAWIVTLVVISSRKPLFL